MQLRLAKNIRQNATAQRANLADHATGVGVVLCDSCFVYVVEEVRLLSTLGFLVGAKIGRARLESENAQLTNRLQTRTAVDRTKTVLQDDLQLTEEKAYQRMQRESRQRRKSMREIAEAILLSEELRR